MADKLEKESSEKIYPNSKRLKLDDTIYYTPLKIDNLITNNDQGNKDESDVKPPIEESKVPVEPSEKPISKDQDQVVEAPSNLPKEVEPSKLETEKKS